MSKEKDLNEREERFFGRMKVKARKIVNDRVKLKELLADTQKKMEASSSDDSLKAKIVEFLSLIMRMISSYLKGVYTETPWQTIIMFVAGLIYFVTPIDAIPDFIPVAGLIDDATVLVWLGKSFRSDVDRFKKWEESNDSE
ncbi:YkvA family protein [Roseivirga seohaensis]|uniref:YkvA family protein n=1 Tax=Roseivirga seohaensis TaxID=1914963 RepID=UPI003BAC8640